MSKESLNRTLENVSDTLRKARELIVALREAGVTRFEVVDEKTGEYFGYPCPHPFVDDPIAKPEDKTSPDS